MTRIQHIRRWLGHRNALLMWNCREAQLLTSKREARYAQQREAIEQRLNIVHTHQRRLERRMYELQRPISDIFKKRTKQNTQ